MLLMDPTRIPEILLFQPEVFSDDRGFFFETFQQARFSALGIHLDFLQDNHSGSKQGILRGLHYQVRRPQGKLLRVVVGEVFDVAVDLRRSSMTFGQWVGVNLSAGNRKILWVPPGFAHGFYTLSEWAEVLYKATDYYSPEWERTLRWDDPGLGIEWPLVDGQAPILSAKDANGTSLAEAETYP
jgi:dTDP-4-dehydrorhamnose 3,5-epimerase